MALRIILLLHLTSEVFLPIPRAWPCKRGLLDGTQPCMYNLRGIFVGFVTVRSSGCSLLSPRSVWWLKGIPGELRTVSERRSRCIGASRVWNLPDFHNPGISVFWWQQMRSVRPAGAVRAFSLRWLSHSRVLDSYSCRSVSSVWGPGAGAEPLVLQLLLTRISACLCVFSVSFAFFCQVQGVVCTEYMNRL